MVLLGVRDDGRLAGLTRPDLEARVMGICRTHLRPELIPGFQRLRDVEPGRDVAVVHVPRGASAHAVWHNNERRQWVIRVGSTSRDASEGELHRLYQQRGSIRFEKQSVPRTTTARRGSNCWSTLS